MVFNNPLLRAIWEQSRIWVVVVTILVLLCVALAIYQAQFVAPQTESLLARKAALTKQLREREAKLMEFGVPISAVEQMEKDLTSFSQLIPKKQNFADFIGELFSLAEQAGLNIRQISYQPEVDKDTSYLIYELNFSVEGSYERLKKFIHLLENSERILFIDSIALSGKRQKDNSAAVDLKIRLSTIFQEDAR